MWRELTAQKAKLTQERSFFSLPLGFTDSGFKGLRVREFKGIRGLGHGVSLNTLSQDNLGS